MEVYDVAVIGAGPAGSTAARIIAEQGWKVLLLDGKEFPREKACGGLLSYKALRLLQAPLPNDVIERDIYGITLCDGRGDMCRETYPYPIGVTVRRSNFDHFLVKQAVQAGAEFINPLQVRDIKADEQGMQVKLYTDEGILLSRKVILAEGVNSCLARKVGLLHKWRRWQLGFTVNTIVESKPSLMEKGTACVEMYCIPFVGGFGWVFPLKDGYNIGVGCWACQSRSLYRYFSQFVTRILRSKGIKQHVTCVQGSYVPAGGFPRRLGNEHMLLVGDCGGFADPFAGEGIYYAVRSAEIAAHQMIYGLTRSTYNMVLNYTKQCRREFYYDFYCSMGTALLNGRKKAIRAGTARGQKFVKKLGYIMKDAKAYRMHKFSLLCKR